MDEFLRNDVNSHQNLIMDHESRLKKLEALILDLGTVGRTNTDLIAEIRITLETLKNAASELAYLRSFVDSFVKTVNNYKEEISKSIDQNSSKIVSLESSQNNEHGAFHNMFDELRQCIIDQNRDAINIHKKISDQANDSAKAIADLEKSIKNWSEAKIVELLPKDNSGVFETLRNELFKKLELIGIDCMNAVLKAGNISNQIPMLERRIENITLILKKYELSQ